MAHFQIGSFSAGAARKEHESASESSIVTQNESCGSSDGHVLDKLSNITDFSSYSTYVWPEVSKYDIPVNSFQQSDNRRHTPTSLGWTSDNPLINLYQFVVPKNQEPYFALHPRYTATSETPNKVYLDHPTQVLSFNLPL